MVNLWGDPTKARTVLGWDPQKTSYEQLVEIMAKHDRMLAKREKAMKEAAKMLEFELAATLRDQIIELRGKETTD